MSVANPNFDASLPAVYVHLLGTVAFDTCLALQQRLVYEARQGDAAITLLLCEHPPAVTIGREGSRTHLHGLSCVLAACGIEPRWVNRGGGAWLHAPGQLAVYPIVPLEHCRLSVGDYLARLQAGLLAALGDVRFAGQTRASQSGIWGRNGQVAAIGVAVKHWVSYFGAYINVSPERHWFRSLEGGAPMSSLATERQRPLRMSAVREALVRRLPAALGCQRCHLFTGHPLLTPRREANDAAALRVG